ncbi:MAG: protein kinase [Leptolyngbyaceae cyanobacterium]
MNYCLNPVCHQPRNPSTVQRCQTCGEPLLLAHRYHICQPISSGGFGHTFLAKDQKTGKCCVIKQCLPGQVGSPRIQRGKTAQSGSSSAFSSDQLRRFRQEGQQLQDLSHHPQIPQLLEAIEQPTASVPALYLVQEWIEGQTLAEELVQAGLWDEAKGRSLLAELLPVLQFIHDRWVIHRDIKPENIIRSRYDGRLVLVDFGAAKQMSRAEMAQKGTVIGSAGYAAPEQMMGQPVFASDLYSLGVTCLHLLTGMHPFDLYAVSQDDWVWTQAVTVPLSPAFVTILNRMVCRGVNQRYRTADAVLTDLKAAVVSPQPADHPGTIRHNPFVRLLQRVAPAAGGNSTPPVPPPWLVLQRSPHQPTAPILREPPADPIKRLSSPLRSAPPLRKADPRSYALAYNLVQSQPITTLAINAEGTLLASGDNQGRIILWHLPSATRWHEFAAHSFWQRDGHRDRITALQFSPEGSVLFSSSADSMIKQWDVCQPRLLQTLTGEGWGISTLILHPDGALLLSGGSNGAIDLWNVKQGQFIQRLWHHTDAVTCLTLMPDGATLWSGSADGRVDGWDLRTAGAIASIPAHYNGVADLVCHPQADLMVTSGGDRTLRFWQLPSLRLRRTIEINREQGTALALHPSGRWLATAGDETQIQLWQLETAISGAIHLSPQCQWSQDWTLTGLMFSPGGDRLISSSSDGTIKIWQSKLEPTLSPSPNL